MASGSLAVATLTLLAVAGSLFAARAFPPARGGVALGALLATELIVFAAWYAVDQDERGMAWPASFVDNVRKHPRAPFRLATAAADRAEAAGQCRLAGLDHVGGYEPMMLRRTLDLLRAANGPGAAAYTVAMFPGRPGPLLDLLGARYWLFPDARPLPPGWRSVGQMKTWAIAENPRALPRAFLVGRSVVLPDEADRLRFLSGPDFVPDSVVVLESGPETPGGAAPPGIVAIRSYEPGSYDLEADGAAESWLVLTEADYPGWTAEVDGRPAEIHRADHGVQALRLPSGHHEVRFRFRPRSLRLGLGIAAAAVAVYAAGTALLLRRRRLA